MLPVLQRLGAAYGFNFCHFVCTVMDFSAAEKCRGMKFCMHVGVVGLLSGQVSPMSVHFGSRGVRGGGIIFWDVCGH